MTTLVLARLLLPQDFGVVAVALVIINSLTVFRDMGLSQALIHRRDGVQEAADTAFFLIPSLGIVLAGIAFLSAPAIASFFNIPSDASIIRVLAICLALSSLGIVPATMLERDLRFSRKYIPEVLPVLGYCAAAITGAIMGLGAWSLVIGELSRSFLLATAIWPFSDWRPRFNFSRAMAGSLLSYGRHIVGAGLAIFLFTTIDNAAVAKGLGPEQLGLYVFAFTLATLPATQVALSVGKVLFPAYSTIQKDHLALSRALVKTVTYMSTVAAPLALATLVLGPLALKTLYGSKWEGAVLVLQILSFYGLFRAIGAGAGEILKSVGKPQYLARVAYAQLALVAVPLYPVVILGGIEGVAVLFTVSILLGGLTAILLACRQIDASYSKVLAGTLYPLAFACLAGLGSYAIAYLAPLGGWPALIAGSLAFAGLYITALLAFQRSLFLELRRLIWSPPAASVK